MNNKHLHTKQPLSKMKQVVVLMLLALFWVGTSFAQVNLVTWNFSGTAGTDFTASAANRNGVRSTGLASIGSGYSLYDITNSNNTTLTYKSATNDYFALQAWNAAFANNTADYIQTSVVLPTGYVFGASNPLSLLIQSGSSSNSANPKSYKVYYQYSSSAAGIPTSALTTATGSVAGSGVPSGYTTSSTTAYDEVDAVPSWANSNTTTPSVVNNNTVTIPAPNNSSSTVLTIQVRLWSGSGANNWRLGIFQLTAPTGDIVAPTPTISSFTPATSTLFAGASAQTLSIVGTNFNNATTATFNGNTKTVTYTSSTQISIPLTATDLQTDGTNTVVVSNGSGNTASANYTVLPTPSVTIANNGTQPSAGNVLQASVKNNVQSFVINNTTTTLATLNTVKAHFTGTYVAGDINSFKVYYNSSNSLASATQVATSVSATTNASQSTTGSEAITFTLNKTLAAGNNYFWVVVNPDASANIVSPVSTVSATALSSSDFGFTTTIIASCSVSAGGTQTITQGQTVYMDDITNQPSGNIAQNAKVVLAGFFLNPFASSVFSGVNVYATGSATATDITSIAIYKDVNSNGVYDAGTDVLVSTNAPTFSTSNTTPIAFTLNQTISSKTQYLIVATIADVFVSTIGHTVQLGINDQDFTVTNYPAAGSINAANSLSIVAPTGTSTLATSGTPAATISSLVNISAAAVPVYSFTYHNDNANTSAASLISQIVIGQGSANSALFVNWTGIIGGATLSDGTNTITGTVGASGITFASIPTTAGTLGYVATNTTKTYTLSIYLAPTLSAAIQQGINGSQLAFALSNSSITVTGSTLAVSQSINSGTTNGAISVVATKLGYVQAPTSGSPNIIMAPSITVQAEDANGNYATGYSGTVTIASSPVGIGGTLSVATTNGLATFSTLQFTNIGTYSVTATSGSLTAVSSNTLIEYALYSGNSGGTAYTWEASNVWGTSSSNTAAQSWTEGDYAYFITKGATVTVGSSHTLSSLNFGITGYTLTGAGTLSLTGSNPSVGVTGAASINLPISSASNLLFTPATGTASITLGGNATANMYSANLPNGATLGLGLNTVNLLNSYPFGTTSSPLYVNSSITSPSMITTSGAGAVTTPMPLIVPNNIVISTGGALSLCPTGGSIYGNIIKYTGVISGAANAVCMSNSLGSSSVFATGGKGMVYFGAKNTYTGTTYMAGNQGSLICGGGDNTLPTTTDVLFYTGATAGDAPFLDLNGSNEKVSSISCTDGTGTTTHSTTNIYPGGVYNSLAYTQSYNGTLHSVNVFDSLISSYLGSGIAVGTKVMGSGIPYGTTIAAITKKTVAGYTIDSLELSNPISSVIGGTANPGFYIFFENPTTKTLSIEGVGNVGGPYDPQVGHTIDRTNTNFGGTINGNLALALTASNASANKLTLLNVNTFIGNTTVTSGTLKLAFSAASAPLWVASATLTVNSYVRTAANNVYFVAAGGTAGTTAPAFTTGIVAATGGTASLQFVGTYANAGTLPSTNSVTVNGGTLEIGASQTLANVTITSGTLLVDAGDTLTITGTFTNTGGTVTNNGTIIYGGSAAFTTGGTTISNNGTLSVTAANLVVATGTLTNAASSTISVTNNTINVTGGTLSNNGILAATSNVTVTGGIFNLNTNQTVNNLSVTSNAATVNIANNTTTTINGTLTYAGNIANSGTLAYGASGGLTYGFTKAKFQFNNAYEFVAPNLPATLTLPVGDTILLDNDYVFPGSLVLNGVISSLGTFLTPNTFTLTGASKTITGNGTIGSIGIAGTVSVPSGSSLNILNKIVLSSGTFTTNNNVTLKSTSIDSSAVVDVVASGLVNGNITVERYIPKGFRSYRDMAPQVYGAGSIFANWQESGNFTNKGYGIFITGSTAADASKTYYNTPSFNSTTGLDYSINGNASVFTFSNPADAWTAVSNSKSTNLDPFQAYRVTIRGDRTFNLESTVLTSVNGSILMVNATTLRATGKLVTGTVKYNTAGITAKAADGTTVTSGVSLKNSIGSFDMIANPYACPVTWGTGTLTNSSSSTVYGASTNLNGTYWYFDPTSAASGSYIAFNAITGSSSHTGVYSNGIIQAGQTVFVQAGANAPEVVFIEGAKATTSVKAKVFGITTPLSKIYLSLKKQVNNTYAHVDGAAIAFSNEFANTTYGVQDALKFGSANDNLSIADKGTNLSIDGRLPATTADVLPIALAKLNNASYKLEIDATSYNGLTPVLKDNYTGTVTDLTIGVNTINFTADSLAAASFANRFSLGFKVSTLAVNSIVASATLSNKVATISWNTVGEKSVSRFEVEKSTDAVSFTKIAQATAKNTTSASYTTTDNSLTTTSYYRIKAISEVGTVSYSNIAKLSTFDSQLSTYSFYPNPLKGGNKVLNVNFSNVAAGNYTVTIINVLGQKVQEATISHLGGTASHAITVNNTLAAGTYTVTISQVGSKQVVSQTKLSVN